MTHGNLWHSGFQVIEHLYPVCAVGGGRGALAKGGGPSEGHWHSLLLLDPEVSIQLKII